MLNIKLTINMMEAITIVAGRSRKSANSIQEPIEKAIYLVIGEK